MADSPQGLTILSPLIVALAVAVTTPPFAAAESPVELPAVSTEVVSTETVRPDTPRMMAMLRHEMVSGLKNRGADSSFIQFQRFAAMKLSTTAGSRTGSEVTGNCRLAWYDHLMRNVLSAPAEAEAFTRELHENLCGDHRGLDAALMTARVKMDLGARAATEFDEIDSPEAALAAVKKALYGAKAGHAASLATLSQSELGELNGKLYSVMVSQNVNGHTLSNNSAGRRLCNLMEKMDRGGIHDAAEALVPLADPELLKQLGKLDDEPAAAVAGASGKIVRRLETPAGTIIVGGRGSNTYRLDEMGDVAAVIDLGGDDVYEEGSVSFQRPVLATIDLAGNDTYRGTKPGIQGGAILGIGMLVDAAGDDTYQARDVAQASGLAGAGLLIDLAGNDTYVGFRRVQGQALCGLGVLIDHGGDDRYHGALWTQGMGGPLGFGVLEDSDGADHYYTGGYFADDYPETPGYDGWGQGVGAGIRSVANGGIGVILDGGGDDDTYEFDYLAHGGGYWLGVGFARDFGGNDKRLGSTEKTYSGGTRTERQYQRFGIGWGCHYTIGFCFDDAGDDIYRGSIMGLGHGWDCAVGVLCDFGGNDRYESTGQTTQGNGSEAGLGVLFDYAGDDYYRGNSQGNARSTITYHDMPSCGGNFSFVVDYGGEDTYGCKAKNNSYVRRGALGGFLIDRSGDEPEAAETADHLSASTTTKLPHAQDSELGTARQDEPGFRGAGTGARGEGTGIRAMRRR